MQDKALYTFFLICLFGIALIPGSIILGEWESLYFFHNFAPLQFNLDFNISPRANVGNPGYSVVEVSRTLIEFFGLNLSLDNFRLTSKFFSILTIYIFFLISKRLFNSKVATLISLILLTNPVFYLYMNTSTIVMASAFGFILLIERLQKIEMDYKNLFNWITLSIPIILISLNYGLIRVYSFTLLILWIINFLVNKRYLIPNSISFKVFLKNLFLSLLISIIFLGLFNLNNLISILQPTFLIPKSSETFILSNLFYKDQTLSLYESLSINLKIIFETLTGFKGNYNEPTLFNILIGYRFPILNFVNFILFLIGLIICIGNFKFKKKYLSNSHLKILVIFIITCIFILSSSVFKSSSGLSITISNHRIFFMLFPIYLLIGLFFMKLFDNSKHSFSSNLIFTISFIFLLSLNLINIFEEKKNFDNLLTENLHNTIFTPKNVWVKNEKYIGAGEKWTNHFDQHLNYLSLAKQIKLLSEGKRHNNIILHVDDQKFLFNNSKLPNFHFLDDYDFNVTFLNLYLNDMNVKTGWVQDLTQSTETNTIGFSNNTIFPIKYDQKRLNAISEINETKRFVLRYHKKISYPILIIVQNSDQEKFIHEFLTKKEKKFITINF